MLEVHRQVQHPVLDHVRVRNLRVPVWGRHCRMLGFILVIGIHFGSFSGLVI